VVGKSGNPQSRDFVLQLVEKYVNICGILSTPFLLLLLPSSPFIFLCDLLAESCLLLKHSLFWLMVL
jgi:hypothetical protein